MSAMVFEGKLCRSSQALNSLFVFPSVGQLRDCRELFAPLPGEEKHPPLGGRQGAHLVTPGGKSAVAD